MPIKLVEGSSYSLDPSFGPLDLVAIGRAFHWMDRAAILMSLNEILTPSGPVVLFDEKHLDVPSNAWRSTYREIYERYVEGGATRSTRYGPGWVSDEAVLLASPFYRLERMSDVQQLSVPLSAIRHRVLSISVTSHARIGAAADKLTEELMAALTPFAEDGALTEVVEFTALLARRP